MLPPQHIQLSLSQTIDPYLIDQLSHLSNQEKDELYQCTDYLQLLSLINDKSISSSMVTSADRRTMCNWSYDIVDACQIDREVAVIGMNYFDRYMSLSTTAAAAAASRHCSSTISSTSCPRVPTTRKAFQLTYITCLIIALKCRGGLQVDSDFVSTTICQGIYQPSEIINMEIEILKVLGWKLNNGSVHDYINGMLELLPPPTTTTDGSVGDDDISREKMKAELKCSAVQIVEKQMLDYTMVYNTSPSVMAYAALLVALSSSSTLSSRNRRRERRLLNPQDRRRWLDNINIVLGIKSTDCNVQCIYDTMMMGCEDRSSSSCSNIVEISSSSPMSTTTPTSRYNSVPPTPTPSRCYTYCTPISSASSSPSIPPPRMNCNNGVRVEEETDEGGGKTTSKSRSSSLVDSSEYADMVSLYTYGAEHLYLDMLSMTSGSGTDDDDDDVGW